MPHIRIITNASSREKINQSLIDEMVAEIAVINGKPAKLFMVSLSSDDIVSMDKTQSSAAHLAFLSIGKIDEESNLKYSEVFFRILNSIGIPNGRIQLTFHDVSKQNFAWNGMLISKMFPDVPKVTTLPPPTTTENESKTEGEDQEKPTTANEKSAACSIL